MNHNLLCATKPNKSIVSLDDIDFDLVWRWFNKLSDSQLVPVGRVRQMIAALDARRAS